MTTMCIGLGMGATVIWENPHHAGYNGVVPGTATPVSATKATPATATEGAAA
jgi:acetyl-CoA acyltransferase